MWINVYDVETSLASDVSSGQTLVAAPGSGFQSWITGYQVQAEEAGPVDVELKAGSDVISRVHLVDDGDGIVDGFHPSFAIPGGDNKAISFTLSAAKLVTVIVRHHTAKVS